MLIDIFSLPIHIASYGCAVSLLLFVNYTLCDFAQLLIQVQLLIDTLN